MIGYDRHVKHEDVRRLYEHGALERLASGRDAVRVTLQCMSPTLRGSRGQRRSQLTTVFRAVEEQFGGRGVSVDLETVSPSGQIVEALVPVDEYENLVDELSASGLRVDVNVERQVH